METLISAVLLPPLNFILVAFVGLMLRQRSAGVSNALILGALVALLVLSTPAGALLVVTPIELPRVAPRLEVGVQAIVVLGGPGCSGIHRASLAVQLQRRTSLPILVTGGSASMVGNLIVDFNAKVSWIERKATTTEQNAKYAAPLLISAGIRRVYLVTDAVHMRRAALMFAAWGIEVVPQPTIIYSDDALNVADFIPSAEGLRRTHYALHEWLGILWYRIRR